MHKPIFSTDILFRIGPSMFGFLVLLALIILHDENSDIFRFIVSIQDGFHLNPPFEDIGAILKAHACWLRHVNVYGPNDCMDGGEYNYSPMLLHAIFISYNSSNQIRTGFALCVSFIMAQSLLPKATSLTELAFRCAALASPATIFALGQGNIDVLIFVILTIAILLISYSRILGSFGYILIGVLAAIKYYPGASLVLILQERLVSAIALFICILVSGLWFFITYHSGTLSSIAIIPNFQPFRATFGAIDLPLGLTIVHILPTASKAVQTARFDPASTGAAAVISAQSLANSLTILAIVFGLLGHRKYETFLRQQEKVHGLFLIAAATILVLCFSAAQNLYYRAIFLLLGMPALWTPDESKKGRAKVRPQMIALVALLLLWQSALVILIQSASSAFLPTRYIVYPSLFYWIFKEALWWWVIIQFYGITFCFLRLSFHFLRVEWKNWKTKTSTR